MTIINPNTLFIGKNFIFLEECDSTNSYAVDVLSAKNIAEGTIIYTDSQRKGKGQKGNLWITEPKKNLTISLILMPKWLNTRLQFYLTKLVSVVLVDFLNENIQKGFKIKWPNDIYFDHKKVGGILIENVIRKSIWQYSVIGIGLNVNQDSFSIKNAISLSNITNKEYVLIELLEKICEKFEANYLKFIRNYKILDRGYLDLLYRRGDIVPYRDADKIINAELIGVTEIGKLVLKVDDEIKTYGLKEIEFIN